MNMFQFHSTVSIADMTNIVLLIVAIIGIFFTYYQIKQGFKTQRAIFFKELYLTLFSDEVIRKAFYQIEYDHFVYDASFHGSPSKKAIERLLSFVDLVCEIYAQKFITEREMSFFKYEIIRVYTSDNIQNYLKFLKDFYKLVETGTMPLSSFIFYCEKESKKSIASIDPDRASS